MSYTYSRTGAVIEGIHDNFELLLNGSGGAGLDVPTLNHNHLLNGNVFHYIINSSAGVNARVGFVCQSDAATLNIHAVSSGYTGIPAWASASVLTTGSGTTGGLIFNDQSTTVGISFQLATVTRALLSYNAFTLTDVKLTSVANTGITAKLQNTHASTPDGLDIDFSHAAPNNTAQYFISCQDQTSTRMLVWSNGDIINANNSYGAISDRKLKQDVTPANSQTADIKAISGIACNFKFISDVDEKGEDAVRHLGVIAQDLELISPGLVKATADRDVDGELTRDADGELTGAETLSVNYSVMYMKAVVALGEALEMIDDLKLRVAALEAV